MKEKLLSTGGRSIGVPTIKDVAARAGVSPMTVSRVLNSEQSVRPDKRALVLSAVSELKYARNASARTLASGKGARIGLLYANPSSGYLAQLLIGALAASHQTNAHLLVEGAATGRTSSGIEDISRLLDASVDGVIVPSPLCEDTEILDLLRANNVPVVTVGRGQPLDDAPNIRIDDSGAAARLTQYLLDLGHSKVALITGHPAVSASRERERGYFTAMVATGGSMSDLMTINGDFTYASGVSATEQLLHCADRPTAIFASNDEMAVAAINTIHRHGLQVPGDISVVGFDDTVAAETVWPALTTVRQPVAMMAAQALRLLVPGRLDSSRRPHMRNQEIVLPFRLITRDSAGPPRKSDIGQVR